MSRKILDSFEIYNSQIYNRQNKNGLLRMREAAIRIRNPTKLYSQNDPQKINEIEN